MAKVTIPDLMRAKREGRKLVLMTAYDYSTAAILDQAGPDIILIGDSGGRNQLGHRDNAATTVDEMVLMTRSVARGVKHAFVVGDLPFMSYQVNLEEAVRNAGRFVKEAEADGVKLEGGEEFAPVVAAIVRAGVPVLGHMGVTPMTSMGMGELAYDQAPPEGLEAKMLRDARALQEAGAFALVLTLVSHEVTRRIRDELAIPILAPNSSGGAKTGDGQVCVTHGVFGMGPEAVGRAPGRYGSVARALYDAAAQYLADIQGDQSVIPTAAPADRR